MVLYPSLAGTTRSLERLLDTHVIFKKETKIEHFVKWDMFSDYIGGKKIKVNPKGIITVKLFF